MGLDDILGDALDRKEVQAQQGVVVFIHPGQKVSVKFRDEDGTELDGTIDVGFGKRSLFVHADMPDGQDRQGIIYSEDFATQHEKMDEELGVDQKEVVGDEAATSEQEWQANAVKVPSKRAHALITVTAEHKLSTFHVANETRFSAQAEYSEDGAIGEAVGEVIAQIRESKQDYRDFDYAIKFGR